MDITDSCLDAETLAAWTDGGLSSDQLERARLHVADCARCQAMVGTMAKMRSAAPPSVAPGLGWVSPRRWLAWGVPLTAAAAAIAIWIAVPRNPAPSSASAQFQEARRVERPQATAVPPAVVAPPTPAPPVTAPPAAPSRSTASSKELDKVAPGTPPTAQTAAAAPSPAAPADQSTANTITAAAPMAMRREFAAPVEIVSPDPQSRWRIAGSVVEHSLDGGATWNPTATGVTTALSAGSSPSALVCWVVGRAGVILVSVDGRTWQRVPFPEATDLVGIRARDAMSVTVTAADGRVFSTTTSGNAWTSGPLQGF